MGHPPKYRTDQEPTHSAPAKLHLGCGRRKIEGWENRDRKAGSGEWPMDVTKKWPYASGTVLAVYCEDLLEHLDQYEQFCFFAEAFRVLASRAWMRINCPQAGSALSNGTIAGKVGRHGVHALNPHKERYDTGMHKLLPTPGYLAEVLEKFGFVDFRLMPPNKSNIPRFPGDTRPKGHVTDSDRNIRVEVRKP